MGYFLNLLKGFDETGNAALDGNPRQTISSRAYEGGVIKNLWYWRVAMHAINAIAFNSNHCFDAYWHPDGSNLHTYDD